MSCSATACSSHELTLSEELPYGIQVRLPTTVREAMENADKKGFPLTLRFGQDFTDGTLCVEGQEFRFRSQSCTGQTKLVRYPVDTSGWAGEVASVQHKCQVQVVDNASGGRTRQVPRGITSSTGIGLAAKAAAANQQFEEDRRKKAAGKRIQHQNETVATTIPGKTTAPEKMKLAFSSKQPTRPVSGSETKRNPAHLAEDTKDRSEKEKMATVPSSPSAEMMEAAKKDGIRGCIIALMHPPGMKVKNPKVVERLVRATLLKIGIPDDRLPSTSNILSELKRLANYQAPAAYVLKAQYREEYAHRCSQANVNEPSSARLSSSGTAAEQHDSAQPAASESLCDANNSGALHDSGRITKRRRILSGSSKAQVWTPVGDAAHRLAAVPSTAAAERAEREALEAVLRERGNGMVDASVLKTKQLHTFSSAKDMLVDASSAPGLREHFSKCEEENPGDADQALVNTARDKWFFSDHLNRDQTAYRDVKSEAEISQLETEYKSKFALLLQLNRSIGLYKEEVKTFKKRADGELSIRKLWDEECTYLMCMDKAFKLLTEELKEIKAKAMIYRERKRSGT